ncbi:hypothetical protein CAEBREN_22735 [Caenorhabditis brenneri]|uniref:SPK domain-containing protein n=1 Tax=Caenorhabditis brenneri TaxID=135651 RepID=G0NQW4_CAEBE|nr:hypothetical protein CAEBREN_22735 [Caenorhabditis brenneri]
MVTLNLHHLERVSPLTLSSHFPYFKAQRSLQQSLETRKLITATCTVSSCSGFFLSISFPSDCIKAKLNGKNILEKFTILAHIVFLLSIPVDKKMKPLIETCGNLVLDPDGHRINFFKSFDGKVWSGTHSKWHGKSKTAENEEEEMAQVEEEDDAQRMQDRMDAQERMNEDAHMPDEDFMNNFPKFCKKN